MRRTFHGVLYWAVTSNLLAKRGGVVCVFSTYRGAFLCLPNWIYRIEGKYFEDFLSAILLYTKYTIICNLTLIEIPRNIFLPSLKGFHRLCKQKHIMTYHSMQIIIANSSTHWQWGIRSLQNYVIHKYFSKFHFDVWIDKWESNHRNHMF